MNLIEKAIEQLDWYFYEDDGEAAEQVTKSAYELLKEIVICDMNNVLSEKRRVNHELPGNQHTNQNSGIQA